MIAYLDCVGGLAGDMLLAALLDAGASEAALREVPGRLGLDGVELRLARVERHGIAALHLEVTDRGAGSETGWRSIRKRVAGAELDEAVRARSLAILTRLAEVEARIHRVPVERVRFHELGGGDTLVDVVGAVTLLAELGVERVVCSTLPTGRGLVSTAHGAVPVPAPATAELLLGAPVVGTEIEAELVTPTGAALATGLADAWGPLPGMTLERVGYGGGTRDLAERANVVRVLLGRAVAPGWKPAEVMLLETNLDDLSPELVPDAAERCFEAGALDVWTVAAGMKKGRPGFVFSALARPEHEQDVARAILRETTALGVRVAGLRRYELERDEETVEVAGASVRVKLGRLDGEVINVAPEHDDCAAVARSTGASVKSVWAAARAACGRST